MNILPMNPHPSRHLEYAQNALSIFSEKWPFLARMGPLETELTINMFKMLFMAKSYAFLIFLEKILGFFKKIGNFFEFF